MSMILHSLYRLIRFLFHVVEVSSLNGIMPLRDHTQHFIRASRLAGRLLPEQWHYLIEEAWRILEFGGCLEITDVSREFGGICRWKSLERLFLEDESWGYLSGPELIDDLKKPRSGGTFHVTKTSETFLLDRLPPDNHFYKSIISDALALYERRGKPMEHEDEIKEKNEKAAKERAETALTEVKLLEGCRQEEGHALRLQ